MTTRHTLYTIVNRAGQDLPDMQLRVPPDLADLADDELRPLGRQSAGVSSGTTTDGYANQGEKRTKEAPRLWTALK